MERLPSISLNWRIIQAPLFVRDYKILRLELMQPRFQVRSDLDKT